MNPAEFYDMFPNLKGNQRLATDFTGVRVTSMSVNKEKSQADISLSAHTPIPPYQIGILEDLISAELKIDIVNIDAAVLSNFDLSSDVSGFSPATPSSPDSKPIPGRSPSTTPNPASPTPKTAIMGRVTKTAPTPIGEVNIDLGRVTVTGEVCANRSRLIEKNNSWLLNFDITDHTGTINVHQFMIDRKDEKNERSKKIVKSIEKGMYLTVSGTLVISNYDNELNLNPTNIFPAEKTVRTDTADEKRVELHLHTKMSASDGLTDVHEVINRAIAWGHPAIAITDHGVVQSFPEAEKTIAKNADKIKIIYGMEGYFCNGEEPVTDGEKTPTLRQRTNHIILLAKNEAGLKNLYKLVTRSHLKHFYNRPVIFKEELEKHRDGLIIGSACERGEFFEAITENKPDEELKEIAKFYDYLEIQPLCNNMFMILGEKPIAKSVEELKNFNKKVIEIGNALNIPVVATCDTHFLNPTDEIFRRIIMFGKGFKSAAYDDLPLFFRTTDEMLEEFSYLGEKTAYDVVIANTNKIAEMCEKISPLPPKRKLFTPKLEDSANELARIIQTRIPELYGENTPQPVIDRADYELKDILRLNYDVIYMTAQKLVSYLRKQHSRVGSRGSVGSSFVAFLAGITEVNPLPAHYRCPKCKTTEFPVIHNVSKYACGPDMPDKTCRSCGTSFIKDGFNIPFETFMGFNGDKIPDIDLNISSEHQSDAHKFIYKMFGEDHVFRAGTIGTTQGKNAFKFVKKYLEATGKTTTKAEESRLADGCNGVKQTTGQHPGGLIVIPQNMDVYDFSPTQYPADDSEKGVITLHFEYKYLEDNLIKLDILGHDNPTMLKMLEDMTGINADDIPLDDSDTMSLFSSPECLGLDSDDSIIGETGSIGIPEFGTPFVRQMLVDTRPGDFDTLIRLSGYSHGEHVWLGNAKELIATNKASVADTISSRDDIMLYLISKGMTKEEAFGISESVRKGYGLPKGTEHSLKNLHIPPWYIESCQKIGYLFPKAHAVAYVIMAFRIAWFKVHRPLEYYSAHFYRRSQYGAFDAQTMTRGVDTVKGKIRELKHIADITKKDEEAIATLESCYEFYMRGFDFAEIDLYKSDAEKFLIAQDKLLRPPFVAIAGLGENAARDLAENRKGCEFISTNEILTACPSVNKSHIASLKAIGALGDLPDSSQMSLF